MNDSKFDDKQRSVFGELVKAVFKWPYRGALVSGRRNAEYAIFHGISKQRVAFGYNAISVARVQAMAEAPPAPDGAPFDARHFTCVARLVPKKNHAMLLQAYRLYCDQVEVPRPLHLCGSGPLEADLRRQVAALGLTDGVVFRGWVQDDEVSRTLAHTVALLLPSTEEQFGIAVIEAQAMGVPVILSDNCGARDSVIRTGVNGFVVEPDNPHGMAFFMARLGEDEVLWRRMCGEALATAPLGDVQRFVEGVETLLSA
ncbi:glycosyltransferase [Roseospira marina]|uniref:glycosyltransferase n=1 Tax=Roseospira marina TaxID=140057 RepID=UPI00147823A1|nr:glycosyltransferase [Roseospira marina]MBB4315779.1 glycosyltransferase involved in cell wall biosynthesis [Roseospira marina]MBB5088982.1 glycosyltransferase involved in cell wall biosynthesis [Roseospira marina]